MNSILHQIASQNNFSILSASRLSGGDINNVFLLKCTSESYVVKLNSEAQFPAMFEAEAKGLDLLRASESFKIPKVITTGTIESSSYLVLEYVEAGNRNPNFNTEFAKNLAKLHCVTRKHFGLDHSNYIGSLAQYNASEAIASDFYIRQRLEPQLGMAHDRGYHFSELDSFFRNISEAIPNEPSSLIHGDLWNGNYLVSEEGKPVLIDPAVAYAPREMDIAMMHLFGGFSEELFGTYDETFPMQSNWKDRVDLWQLYYLLVHLNLFGSGYFQQVKNIIKRFS